MPTPGYGGNMEVADKLYPASYAMDPVLDFLNKELCKPSTKIKTILINLSTCLRNVFDGKFAESVNRQALNDEITTLSNFISSFWQHGNHQHTRIIFYIYNTYDYYATDILRPVTPSKELFHKLFLALLKETPDSYNTVINNTTVHFVPLRNKTKPIDEQLKDLLINTNTSNSIDRFRFNGYYYLITHQPLDFHILHEETRGELLSSHKNETLPWKLLGDKVFQDSNLPFIKTLHFIFGDKYQIKPSATIVEKKKIKARAIERKWMIRTESEIKNDLRLLGIKIPKER
jgi:hypothetical protein